MTGPDPRPWMYGPDGTEDALPVHAYLSQLAGQLLPFPCPECGDAQAEVEVLARGMYAIRVYHAPDCPLVGE